MVSFVHKNKIKKIIFYLLFFCVYAQAESASIGMSPAIGTYEVGDRVTLKILASSNTSINSVAGTLLFNNSLFTVDSISKSGSVISFWVSEPTFSQSQGTVKFEGVTLGGVSGANQTILSVNLIAKKEGAGSFSFLDPQILANDGLGTSVLQQKNTALLTIVPKKVVPIKLEEPVVTKPIIQKIEKEDELKDIEEQTEESNFACGENQIFKTCNTFIKIDIVKQDDEYVIFGKTDLFEKDIILSIVPKTGNPFSIIVKTNNYGDFFSTILSNVTSGPYVISARAISLNDEIYDIGSNEIEVELMVRDFKNSIFRLDLLILLLCLLILSSVLAVFRKVDIKKKTVKKVAKK